MQYSGTLAEADLASLLKTVQTERATGTLSVESPAGSASLYFLFGHLLHAAGAERDGEQVVIDALLWGACNYQFDPRAKLPFEETITASPGDLIEEAERRRQEAGQVAAAAPDPAHQADAPQEAALVATDTAQETPEMQEVPATMTSTVGPQASAPAEHRTGAIAVSTDLAQATAASAVEPDGDAGPVQAAPEVADEERVQHSRRSSDSTPLADMFPLPAGRPVYQRLKSAIVFFPNLISTLRGDRQTGYLRLRGERFQGILLFHDGHLLEALYQEGELTNQSRAFHAVRTRMEHGDGAVDLIELSGETVIALGQLLIARPLYTGLLGRFVRFEQLLEHLAEAQTDGSIVVQGAGDTGVILLHRGQVLGAYTTLHPDLVQDCAQVAVLAAEPGARIEVKGGLGDIEGIDVEQVLSAG